MNVRISTCLRLLHKLLEHMLRRDFGSIPLALKGALLQAGEFGESYMVNFKAELS